MRGSWFEYLRLAAPHLCFFRHSTPRVHRPPTYSTILHTLVTYVPPTPAGAAAHATALTALGQLHDKLRFIISEVARAGGSARKEDYIAIKEVIDEHGAAIEGLLAESSSTATTAAVALNQVRMHATQTINTKTAIGSPDDWAVKMESALMDLELANARAIADADQCGEIV